MKPSILPSYGNRTKPPAKLKGGLKGSKFIENKELLNEC